MEPDCKHYYDCRKPVQLCNEKCLNYISEKELKKEQESQLKGELEKYRTFFECCSCLFAEGVEFMTKTEIYDVIKKEVKRLESCG